MHPRKETGFDVSRRTHTRRTLLKGVAGGALGFVFCRPQWGRAAVQTMPAESGVLRTLLAHEITHWELPPIEGYGSGGEQAPIISADGSGDREIDSYTPLCYCGSNIDISGDGATVAYVLLEDYARGIEEAGVIAFGGGDRFKVTDSTRTAPGIGVGLPSGERIQFDLDGTHLLLGSTGVLYDTTDGTVIQLGDRGGFFSSDTWPLVANDLLRPTMTTDASRVL